jgi:chromosome segregation ATPase
LEKQLEDTATLNQSLEEEFQLLKDRVGVLEREKLEHVQKVRSLEASLTEYSIKLKESQLEIENLENEKCNYIFELNELKSEDERNILQKELKEYKAKALEIEENFKKLQVDHECLSIKYNTLFTDSQQKLAEIVSTQQESGRLLQEKQVQLQNASIKLENLGKLGEELQLIKQHNHELQSQVIGLQKELENAGDSRANLERKIEELTTINESNLENLKNSQELIQNLQHNLLHNNVEELRQENQELKEINSQITVEKENLIALVTTKHQENVNYHNEIVRLNEVLANTSVHSGEKLEELQVIKNEFKISLGRLEAAEKELRSEQSQRKFLEKEKVELNEHISNLQKDIERLRQHLMETADEYTAQTVDLQKSVDEYKNKLIAIEEEAKKSATAYTSAR